MWRNRLLLILLILITSVVISCGQERPQISPEENQATQTASAFLDLCRQGKVQEAIDDYVIKDPLFPSESDIRLYQNVLDYKIQGAILDNSAPPAHPSIKTDISVRNLGDIEVQFYFTLDGSRISGQVTSWGENTPL